MLNNFQEIVVESLTDQIIQQIRQLIATGQLKPGDKLPSERKLCEKLGVGRGNVRDAIKKLEFYGILKTLPQSGTIVAGMGILALEGLITDVLKLEKSDFDSLVETRLLLEVESARLAAQRRTEQDIENIKRALAAYEEKIKLQQTAVEEDLMFHLKIAEASKNSVLRSFMLIITPDIIKNFIQLEVCQNRGLFKARDEHQDIVKHIIAQEPDKAVAAMKVHLRDVVEYSRSVKNESEA
ncbi:MAG: FadR family transcriptional regulator [Cyanothece sp. SIO1E1]|nr:FadR family transcriptional regulator [Cyanothece sp. SIO1E1]